jgi:hypothetical protein
LKRNSIPNRIFVGYPWKTYKPIWEGILSDIHKKYPLHFYAIGREPGQPALQLLNKILGTIDSSSLVLIDSSTGNPNVSLEYGYAKAKIKEDELFLFIDEESAISTSIGAPIISDLAGTTANKYKFGDKRLKETIVAIAENHNYTKRFNRFCRRRSYKGGTRKLLVRIIRKFDGVDSVLRRELLDDLSHEARKTEEYIEKYLRELHGAGLITITRGNEYSSRVAISG